MIHRHGPQFAVRLFRLIIDDIFGSLIPEIPRGFSLCDEESAFGRDPPSSRCNVAASVLMVIDRHVLEVRGICWMVFRVQTSHSFEPIDRLNFNGNFGSDF